MLSKLNLITRAKSFPRTVYQAAQMSTVINDNDAVVVSYARTPIGSIGGGLSSFSAPQLGALAIEGAMKRATDASPSFKKEHVGEVIVGMLY